MPHYLRFPSFRAFFFPALSRLYLTIPTPSPFCFVAFQSTMPPKKSTAAPKSTASKASAPKSTAKATTPAPKTKTTAAKTAPKATPGRGRPKKMETESAPKAAPKASVKKETADKSRKTTGAATTTTSTSTANSSASRKRKADAVEEKPRVIKKPRVVQPREPKPPPPKIVINEAPTTRLNVFVCGEGSSGELGLGTAKNVIDVKRPRLNQLLAADKVGIVQVAVGGMHCVALSHDNQIYSWGVNDQGALGRDTQWDGGYKDMDDNSDSDSEDDDSGLNPRESTPTAIPGESFPKGVVFVQVAAADSASFALTDDGLVYGWGTFRVRLTNRSTHNVLLTYVSSSFRAMTVFWASTRPIAFK